MNAALHRVAVFFSREQVGAAGVLALILLLSFARLGAGDLKEWDESRNGVNAYEMVHNDDWVNLYYDGKLDTWNAKPPLMIWAIAGSYRVFGYSEWALRAPSALAGLLFFFCFYALVRRLSGYKTALLSCLILCGCKALLDHHVFRTGDFDGLLVCWLTASVYCFARAVDEEEWRWMWGVGLFTGLAFFTKGTAAAVLLPGMVFYLVARGRLGAAFRSPHSWLGLAITAAFVTIWCVLVLLYGKMPENPFYESRNALETMVLHDTYRRLADEAFTPERPHSPAYFFLTLDARFNLWNYFFYLSTAFLIARYVRLRRTSEIAHTAVHRPELLFLCLILPLAIVLSIAKHTHDWYLAPAMPFIAGITAIGLRHMITRWKYAVVPVAALAAFAIARHGYHLLTPRQRLHQLFSTASILRQSDTLLLSQPPRQHAMLYCLWRDQPWMIVSWERSIAYTGRPLLVMPEEAASWNSVATMHWKEEEYALMLAR